MDQLPKVIVSDFADVKAWVMNSIASPGQFQTAYNAIKLGRTAEAIPLWLACCETLLEASTYKAFYPRRNRYLDRDDFRQSGRLAATMVLNKAVHDTIREPIRYAWTSIKREIHLAAFGKPRECDCRVDGICKFACDCRDLFDINCDCKCGCKCHPPTVSNFTNHFEDGEYDPIDPLAEEGSPLSDLVDDINFYCKSQIQRDVVFALAEAIRDGMPPNWIYLTLDYTHDQILEAWKAVAVIYGQVLRSRGEPLPGRLWGNQRRRPKMPPGKLAA
jgi:hypothetical protein